LRGATDSFLPYRVLEHSGEKVSLVGLAGIASAGDRKETLLSARKQDKIRFIGFTGHKSPDIHLKMLQGAFAHQFTFDAVQCHEPANQRGITGCESPAILLQAIRRCPKLQSQGLGQGRSIAGQNDARRRHGKFELYMTTQNFDRTYQHPEWLG